MKRHSTLVVAAVAAATALALSGCSSSTPASNAAASSSPVKGGALTMAWSADVLSMDKTTTFDNNSIRVMEQIMEPLFQASPDGTKLEPWLATGYTISDDKLTYTIKLREGVTFSDGTPVTSADVKFSIDEDTKTADTGWGFINAAIDKVTATDPMTVTIGLKYAWAPLIADLSLFSNGVIPNNYGGKTAEQFYTAPVGTGPFVWDAWKKGESLTLTANSKYWQPGKPYLDRVTWNVVPDATTRKLQVQGGQIDIDDTPDWSSLASLKSSAGVNALTFPSTQLDYIAFNQQKAPFDDVHIRKAISMAIDREALVKAVLFGNGAAADSLLAPGVPFYDGKTGAATFDVAGAKAEMAKSTKPAGFSTSLLISSGNPNQGAVAQIMQAELKEIGITMEIRQLDPTANKKARLASDFDMATSAWTMDIPDPDEWTSFAVDPNGGSHSTFTYYNNPDVIAINKKAQQETDDAKRQVLYTQLQTQAAADAFLAYLYYSPYVYATTDKVVDFHVTPLGNYLLQDVYKTQ